MSSDRSAPSSPGSSRPLLPQRGVARVKNVLSGDTAVLLGKAAPGQPAPEVVFTFERVTAPRCVMSCALSFLFLGLDCALWLVCMYVQLT